MHSRFTLQCIFAVIAPSRNTYFTCIPQDDHLPSVRLGASAVYVRRNLFFFQLRLLLIRELLAFSMFTSSPTQNTSQAAYKRKQPFIDSMWQKLSRAFTLSTLESRNLHIQKISVLILFFMTFGDYQNLSKSWIVYLWSPKCPLNTQTHTPDKLNIGAHETNLKNLLCPGSESLLLSTQLIPFSHA